LPLRLKECRVILTIPSGTALYLLDIAQTTLVFILQDEVLFLLTNLFVLTPSLMIGDKNP